MGESPSSDTSTSLHFTGGLVAIGGLTGVEGGEDGEEKRDNWEWNSWNPDFIKSDRKGILCGWFDLPLTRECGGWIEGLESLEANSVRGLCHRTPECQRGPTESDAVDSDVAPALLSSFYESPFYYFFE